MKKFFHRIHLKFVQWFAAFFLRHANKAVRRVLVVGGSYQDLSHLSIVLLSLTNEVVRQHLINVGKNPDVVTSTQNPVVVRDATEREQQAKVWENGIPEGTNPHWIVDPKARPNIWNAWGGSYVHDPAQHPVLQSRAALEAKQQETVEVNINVTMEPLADSVTEVGTAAIDHMREAIKAIEAECNLQPIVEPNENKSE